MTETFPTRPFGAVVHFEPDFRNATGPDALAAPGQVVGSGAGRWTATMSNIRLRSPATHLLWDALKAATMGKLYPVVVEKSGGRRQPLPAGFSGYPDPVPFSDETTFSDGAGFQDATVQAALAGAVEAGDTTAVIDVAGGVTLSMGHKFSIGQRLYLIRSIEAVSGSQTTVLFWPRAREDHPDTAIVSFDRLRCKMRIASDSGMAAVPTMDRFANLSLSFIEDWT